MSNGVLGALIGIGFLIIVNIVTVAYLFGKLTQKVDGLNHLITALSKSLEKLEERQIALENWVYKKTTP